MNGAAVVVCFLAISFFNEISAIPTLQNSGLAAPGESAEPEKVSEKLLRAKRSNRPGKYYYSYSTEGSQTNYELESFDDAEIIEFDDTDGVHSYRNFKTLTLPFDFPFYGSPVREVSVMFDGFLTIGDVRSTWARDKRFIAPFRARFKTSGTNSTVKYISNELFFSVLWSNLELEMIPTRSATFNEVLAKFTFSATIRPDGMINFAYISVPELTKWYPSEGYLVGTSNTIPIIPGLSVGTFDDDVIQWGMYDLSDPGKVSNGSIINLKPKQTCNMQKNCTSCMGLGSNWNCIWCPSIQRCSDFLDNERIEWYEKCVVNTPVSVSELIEKEWCETDRVERRRKTNKK
ncbi:Hypothetical predicted protein [Cloeon dipterum]|uniref:PSI domain-containing protein n=1 Tax=Cloeon dipterum TaxID=197152 RepID=A0A8S1D1P3_9INSE|nr:Hypothetical predicted protein [Cloeon dipterum]